MEQFFLDRDNSGHWYIVPVAMKDVWDDWRDLDEDDDASWTAPDGVRRVPGGTRLVTFTNPVIE
jgi:hypothetical protein